MKTCTRGFCFFVHGVGQPFTLLRTIGLDICAILHFRLMALFQEVDEDVDAGEIVSHDDILPGSQVELQSNYLKYNKTTNSAE